MRDIPILDLDYSTVMSQTKENSPIEYTEEKLTCIKAQLPCFGIRDVALDPKVSSNWGNEDEQGTAALPLLPQQHPPHLNFSLLGCRHPHQHDRKT